MPDKNKNNTKKIVFSVFVLILFMAGLLYKAQFKETAPLDNNINPPPKAEIKNLNPQKINNKKKNEPIENVSTVSGSARTVKNGDSVTVNYVGKLEDGTIFDSNLEEFAKKTKNYKAGNEYGPYEIKIGSGQFIVGFDNGLLGMKVGEKKTVTVTPEYGYGTKEYDLDIPLEDFIKDKQNNPFYGKDLKVGMVGKVGEWISLKILKIGDQDITVQVTNLSELAGKNLIFDLEVTDIK